MCPLLPECSSIKTFSHSGASSGKACENIGLRQAAFFQLWISVPTSLYKRLLHGLQAFKFFPEVQVNILHSLWPCLNPKYHHSLPSGSWFPFTEKLHRHHPWPNRSFFARPLDPVFFAVCRTAVLDLDLWERTFSFLLEKSYAPSVTPGWHIRQATRRAWPLP